MIKRQRIRSLEKVREDVLWPSDSAAASAEQAQGRRYRAVGEVLCRIPEKDYRRLMRMANSFLWFIPPKWRFAGLYAFPWTVKQNGRVPHAKVLYLNPGLEHRSLDLVVAVVAHELAHVVLKHKLFVRPGEYAAQERAVFQLLRRWGFEREAKKHQAEWKRHADLKSKNPLVESLGR